MGTVLGHLPTWAVSRRLQNKQPGIFQKWTRQSLIKVWGRSRTLWAWNPPERRGNLQFVLGRRTFGSRAQTPFTCPSRQHLAGRGEPKPLLAGKCYLKVNVTHGSRLMVWVVFSHCLDGEFLFGDLCLDWERRGFLRLPLDLLWRSPMQSPVILLHVHTTELSVDFVLFFSTQKPTDRRCN